MTPPTTSQQVHLVQEQQERRGRPEQRARVHGIKLFVSMMIAFGIPDQTFGDKSAQGPIPELMV